MNVKSPILRHPRTWAGFSFCDGLPFIRFASLRLLAWLLRCAVCLGPCAFPVFAHAQIVPFVPSASAGADARSAVPLPPIDSLPAVDGLSVRQRDALQPPLPGAKLTKDATTKDGLLKDGAALNEPPRPCGPLGCRGEAIDCPPSADGRPTSITRRADGTPELPDPCGRPRAASQPALTDFQVFVQQSTGRALPLFGYNFFSTTTTYRSLDNVPVPDDYVLGPGDEVLLHAWGGVAGDQRLVVDRNGQVSIPGVGVVTVAGARASELDSLLRGGLGRYFTDFNVNAALGRLRSIPVYVVGKAMSPGSYTVPGTSTIIGALFASGGPAFNGSMRAVALYRNGRQIAALDVYGFPRAAR
ncbi:polysaccharide biosynthesis/export family protein [Burkholderia pseudomallei]|nr:polysaccharide biosynthesis/export family protein [Burkholderia pseudomallei]